MTVMEEFGARLREAREQAGYRSGHAFSAVLGIEKNRYRFYERGQAQPPFDVLIRICWLLHIDVSDLLPMPRVPPIVSATAYRKYRKRAA